ncbi:MAG: HAMP domain-containing sensor histidine kinase [Polyangia bacterium]|nr:HAMP domain-containing sensor histidine kinase [Polyangia bacterium]
MKALLPTLAVLVPAVALAVLGLRSYKAEQVLAENRFQGSLRSIVDLTATGLEEAAHAAIRELADHAREGVPSDVTVERVKSRHPLVGQVFVLGRQGEFLYPAISMKPATSPASLSAILEEPAPPQAGAQLYQLVAVYHRRLKRDLEAQAFFTRARGDELAGRLPEARRGFNAVTERSMRLAPEAWLGLARVSLREGQMHEAARSYAVLTERYASALDWAGVSYELIGRLGLLLVSRRCHRGSDMALTGQQPSGAGDASGAPTGASRVAAPGVAAGGPLARGEGQRVCPRGLPGADEEALRLYSDLVHDRLPADIHRRLFYIEWVRSLLRPPEDSEGRSRLAELDASVSLLRVGMRFAAELGPMGASRLVQRAGWRPRALREDGFRGGETLFVVQAVSSRVVGFVLNQSELVSQLQRQQGRHRLPDGYVASLVRLPVAEREQPAQLRPLDEVLGDLGLMVRGPARKKEGFWAEGAAEYLGVVGALVLVLLAGLVTIWRGVRHETELARLRSEFVSNVSHELKTPLTSIRMFGEMLQQELQPDLSQRRKYYSIIVAESDRLGRLINNVLDFSRMDRGTKTYAVERHGLADLAREAVETFRNFREAEGFKVSLKAEAEPEIAVDRDALVQSLLNLLTNAVKYSGEGRIVSVWVGARGKETSGRSGRGDAGPSEAVVEVRDQGIGIPRSEQRRIFEDFFRASNAPKGQEGAGLGLALVRRHCESLGGRVEVESELGRGSTFRLVFPVAGTLSGGAREEGVAMGSAGSGMES